MTQPPYREALNPLEIMTRQGEAIEKLTQTVGLMQRELQDLRRRVQALEGVPWPEEPPDPG